MTADQQSKTCETTGNKLALYANILRTLEAGQKTVLQYLRDGKVNTVEVVLVER